MAEDSMLWTTSGTGDGPGGGYTQQNWLDLHRYLFTPDVEGTQFILPRKGNKLACTAGASSVNVDTGAAFVYGFFYKNTASVNVPITTPTLGTTGIRVVLRASWAAQTVRATVIRNSDGVSAVPAATQTPGTTYDVTLATGTITTGGVVTLADARAYLQPAWEIAGSMLNASIVDNSTLELVANQLRVKDAGITAAKLAAAIAGNGLSGGAGTALAVNVDNSSIEINADSLRVKALGITGAMLNAAIVDNSTLELVANVLRAKDLGISTAKLANLAVTNGKLADDSVDYNKIGNRVMKLFGRQGNDATNWILTGNTNFTPTTIDVQIGAKVLDAFGGATITFPNAFSSDPIVFTQPVGVNCMVNVNTVNFANCQIYGEMASGSPANNVSVLWIAIGQE